MWIAIGVFTALSATNDVAIDGYTIEFLDKHELGLANGIRIGLYRVGMLASGFVLMLSDALGWPGAFVLAAVVFFGLAAACLAAPRERAIVVDRGTLRAELAALAHSPFALATLAAFALARRVAGRPDDEVVGEAARVLAGTPPAALRCSPALVAIGGRAATPAAPRRRPARRATTRSRAARCSAR